jgi:hypothetical protein
MQHLSFKNAFCSNAIIPQLKNIAEHVSRLDYIGLYNVGGTNKLTTLTVPKNNGFLATVLRQTIFSLTNFLQKKDTNMYDIK